mmetsp:Transcript_160342/g.514517  ORF Transcript_160342/g.514517 Transcript_160342/m.514517 type:complete len:756 (-) Transcript_160342:67-2334(-)
MVSAASDASGDHPGMAGLDLDGSFVLGPSSTKCVESADALVERSPIGTPLSSGVLTPNMGANVFPTIMEQVMQGCAEKMRMGFVGLQECLEKQLEAEARSRFEAVTDMKRAMDDQYREFNQAIRQQVEELRGLEARVETGLRSATMAARAPETPRRRVEDEQVIELMRCDLDTSQSQQVSNAACFRAELEQQKAQVSAVEAALLALQLELTCSCGNQERRIEKAEASLEMHDRSIAEVTSLHDAVMHSAGDITRLMQEMSQAVGVSEYSLRQEIEEAKRALQASDVEHCREILSAMELSGQHLAQGLFEEREQRLMQVQDLWNRVDDIQAAPPPSVEIPSCVAEDIESLRLLAESQGSLLEVVREDFAQLDAAAQADRSALPAALSEVKLHAVELVAAARASAEESLGHLTDAVEFRLTEVREVAEAAARAADHARAEAQEKLQKAPTHADLQRVDAQLLQVTLCLEKLVQDLETCPRSTPKSATSLLGMAKVDAPAAAAAPARVSLPSALRSVEADEGSLDALPPELRNTLWDLVSKVSQALALPAEPMESPKSSDAGSRLPAESFCGALRRSVVFEGLQGNATNRYGSPRSSPSGPSGALYARQLDGSAVFPQSTAGFVGAVPHVATSAQNPSVLARSHSPIPALRGSMSPLMPAPALRPGMRHSASVVVMQGAVPKAGAGAKVPSPMMSAAAQPRATLSGMSSASSLHALLNNPMTPCVAGFRATSARGPILASGAYRGDASPPVPPGGRTR